MFGLVLALAAVTAHPGQTMTGSAFERFARFADRSCPLRQLRTVTPGDLSWEQEAFEEYLSPARSRRLARADRQGQRCMGPGGLTCPTSRTLDALRRAGMLPAFSRFACTHVAPAAARQENGSVVAAANTAMAILQHLDLDSFPNSTGPRRQRSRHTPTDYGFDKLASFDDGWAQISEPEDGWHMSALLLDGGKGTGTICFLDTGGKGARYRATQVLHVTHAGTGYWTAVQVPDRPDCRNDPPFAEGAKAD